jgi:hypothetical protein
LQLNWPNWAATNHRPGHQQDVCRNRPAQCGAGGRAWNSSGAAHGYARGQPVRLSILPRGVQEFSSRAALQKCRVSSRRALIVDLRREASLASIHEAAARMELGFFSAWLTRLTFRFMLLKRLHQSGFRALLAQTSFAPLRSRGRIGMDIWLQK